MRRRAKADGRRPPVAPLHAQAAGSRNGAVARENRLPARRVVEIATMWITDAKAKAKMSVATVLRLAENRTRGMGRARATEDRSLTGHAASAGMENRANDGRQRTGRIGCAVMTQRGVISLTGRRQKLPAPLLGLTGATTLQVSSQTSDTHGRTIVGSNREEKDIRIASRQVIGADPEMRVHHGTVHRAARKAARRVDQHRTAQNRPTHVRNARPAEKPPTSDPADRLARVGEQSPPRAPATQERLPLASARRPANVMTVRVDVHAHYRRPL